MLAGTIAVAAFAAGVVAYNAFAANSALRSLVSMLLEVLELDDALKKILENSESLFNDLIKTKDSTFASMQGWINMGGPQTVGFTAAAAAAATTTGGINDANTITSTQASRARQVTITNQDFVYAPTVYIWNYTSP